MTYTMYKEYPEYLQCEDAEHFFGETTDPISHNGDISVQFLQENQHHSITLGAREYQREKVASLQWKQAIILTILSKSYAKIPQVHLRVIQTEGGGFIYEVVDGQQRLSTVLDFINGGFRLPLGDEFIIDGCDCQNLKFADIKQKYPKLYEKIMRYRISCLWYENLEDEQVSDLFVNVLNNVNDMKEQEIRNAVRGHLSTYIRDTARFEDMHELFERMIVKQKNSKKEKEVLRHFAPKFALKGRMEVDEWISEFIFLKKHGYENGVTPKGLTEWVKDVQKQGSEYTKKAAFLKDKKVFDEMLDFAYKVITAVPDIHKDKLTPWLAMILVLYADSLRTLNYNINESVYVKRFFDVYKKWSDTKTKLYINHTMANGKSQLQPFNELFGGKNANAIKTIIKVLEIERALDTNEFGDSPSFGLTKLDDSETFPLTMILEKWEEQDGLDYYSGEKLKRNNLAGDHYIPRSWGIAKGGTTTYENLVVTSKPNNLRKGARHGDDFKTEFVN